MAAIYRGSKNPLIPIKFKNRPMPLCSSDHKYSKKIVCHISDVLIYGVMEQNVNLKGH